MAMKTVHSKRPLTLGLGMNTPELKVGKNENIPEEYLQGWFIAGLLESGDITIEDQQPATFNHDNIEEVEVVIEVDDNNEIKPEEKPDEVVTGIEVKPEEVKELIKPEPKAKPNKIKRR